MTADVIAFPRASSKAGPLRFTAAERNAAWAIALVPGLRGFLAADDDGDEYFSLEPADCDDLPGFDAASIIVATNGFYVLGGGFADLGNYPSVHQALAVARGDVERRRAAFDPNDHEATWRDVMARLGLERGAAVP